jgi:CheY-like chemotaxis protein
MPEGGYLYLETENMVLDKTKMDSFTINPGRYVKVSVTDTGMGMDKKTQHRVFEPFFSTREMEQGIGLGLAATHGIIKNHGGVINVYSELGYGTTFNIYLPASDRQAFGESGKAYELLKGTENILIVDDEDIPRDVGKDILESLGYGVLTAKSGNEAIEIYSAKYSEIDMVILDMIMSDMDVEKTFERLCKIDSDVRVLLSSGYTMNERVENILNQGCKGFIQKPFNMTLLSQKTREILDRT